VSSPRFYWGNGMPRHKSRRFATETSLEPGPLLDRQIRQTRTFLKQFTDIYVGMVLESLRDATVYVFPAREPLDLLALCFRFACNDRLLQGNLVSLGDARCLGGNGHQYSTAGQCHGDKARK